MTRSLLFGFILFALVAPSWADHGPGTSAGGFSTQSAETLKKKQWAAGLHLDWTEFETVDTRNLAGLEHFDLLDRSFLTTFSVSAGVTDNLQIGIAFGYYAAEGARRIPHDHGGGGETAETTASEPPGSESLSSAAESRRGRRLRRAGHSGSHIGVLHSGHGTHGSAPNSNANEADKVEESPEDETELASFEPDGWTDLWLTAKYRAYRGPIGQLSFLGGVKFPVGETRVYDSAGLRVEPASTPGTGAWDFLTGVAYTFPVTQSITLDASAQYVFRGEKFDYELGDRFDAGIAVGWRFWGGSGRFPHASLIGEANVRHIQTSKEFGGEASDTGGTALFLSPGFRIAFGPHASWSAGVQFPVLQDLNGNQVEARFRISTSFAVSF